MRIRNTKNRQGLTLLFVVSMIVLFLLMGTTFVIISNDYYKSARKRSLANTHSVDRTALVQSALLDIIRGPDLLNTNSPLRGIDLLSDQYGYGFKATVSSAAPVNSTTLSTGQLARGQLIEIILSTTSTKFRPAGQVALDNGVEILGLRDILADAAAESSRANPPFDLSGRVFDTTANIWSADDVTFLPSVNKQFFLGLDTPGYFSGQILTFTNGAAQRVSARIVDYTVTENSTVSPPVMIRRFIILPERVPNGTRNPFDTPGEIANLGEIRNGSGMLTNRPSTIIINGKPFSGIGAGASSFTNIRPESALRPNNARYGPSGYTDLSTGSTQWDATGDPFFDQYARARNSVNEPYDTFDHDNVFLAQNLPTGPVASYNPVQLAPKHANVNASNPNLSPPKVIQQNAYSFRPVFQWDPEYENDPANPVVLPSSTAGAGFPNIWDKTVSLASRPAGYEQLGIPHELQTRPLDIDNDQDGILDSVWVDFGNSIITTRDGRRIKPMVAAMIVDLDNRLNANVHGNFAQAQSIATTDPFDRPGTYSPGYMGYFDLLGIDSSTDTGSIESWELARGLGWGPAEVSLVPLAPPQANPNLGPDYRPLLVGSINTSFDAFPAVPGRYGLDRFPGNSFFDNPARWRFLDHPYPGTIGGTFQGRSMDIHGRFATGFPRTFETHTIPDPADATNTINVDVPYGTPVVDIGSSTWPPAGPLSYSDPTNNPFPTVATEIYNSPYEISLIQDTRRGDDLLYSPDELEAILRASDVDSNVLSSRLAIFGLNRSTQRHLVTTDSWEVPTLPPTLFQKGGVTVNQTIPERLYDILILGIADQNRIFMSMRGGILTDTSGDTTIHSLLAPEVMRGLPMDVNRVFGDGRDNNGNGIIDEHWNSNSAAVNESVSENYPLNASVGMDHNNDGLSGFQDRFARQIYARHLFVLTWLVAGGDWDGGIPSKSNPSPPDMDNDGDQDDDDIAFLAQWCANIVDFRDADSICTPFKYDKNPWDGWQPSPNIRSSDPDAYDGSNPDVGIVWGNERPELLFSEALATHERRYEDDGSGNGMYESNFVPKASVFVEIYNPWTATSFSGNVPAEFYQNGSVDLARHHNSISGGASGDPVWRLAFTIRRGDEATDPDSRRVYMREPTANVESSPGGNFYYPSIDAVDTNGNNQIDPDEIAVAPNRYAVIGSSGVERATGEFRTTFGRRTDLGPAPQVDLKLDETRSITLIPGTGVEFVDGDDGSDMMTETRTCTAVPIDTKGMGAALETRSLGLTDPIGGYPASIDIDPNGDADPSDGDGKQFLTPQVPVADDQTEFPEIFREGNSYAELNASSKRPQFVKLQRLANPTVEYNAKTNPYITVDVAPVDLLSFNGLADTDNDISSSSADVLAFDSHERGEMKYHPNTANPTAPWTRALGRENERFLWPEENIRRGMTDVAKLTTDEHFFPFQFEETFGVMNDTYRGIDANVANKPFMWFTWNNRPYVSQYELVNVPLFRSRNVLNNFDNDASQVPQLNDSPIKRVFDFLDVPSRFVNMEVGFSPTMFAGESPRMNVDGSGNSYVDNPTVFNPPYNYVSRYRYPGKININTLKSNQIPIWTQGMFPFWQVPASSLAGVRADSTLNNSAEDLGGYGSSASARSTMIVMDPIRPDGCADVDLPFLDTTEFNGVQSRGELSNGESDGSILRTTGESNFFRTAMFPHADTSRDYWFTNSSVSKLSNISTDRSSVFAIWITVGYFEVDDFGRVGAEVGSDTGEITRNRGFYIYDRSIPVGFEPGKNHNVERGILVQSIIE